MRTILPSATLAFVLAAVFSSPAGLAQGTAGTAASSGEVARSSSDAALVKTYCAGCHNERNKTSATASGVILERVDLSRVPEQSEMWENVVRRLRAR